MSADYNRFVDLWLEAIDKGEPQLWIAEQMDISRQRVSMMASYLRGRGVELPKISPHKGWFSVEEVEAFNQRIKERKHETH